MSHPQQPNYPPQHAGAPGPPPMPPIQPTYVQTNHVLHLILTLLTFTVWAWFVWPWLAIVHAVSNGSKRRQYEHELKQYNHDYWLWQQRQT